MAYFGLRFVAFDSFCSNNAVVYGSIRWNNARIGSITKSSNRHSRSSFIRIYTMDKAVNRVKAIDAAVSSIEKQFGKGAIMRLGKDQEVAKVEAISTGALSLDGALGIGGIPKGRIVEIYGPESSGKTTLTLHLVSEAQKAGGVAAFVDAEHALDTVYAKKHWC